MEANYEQVIKQQSKQKSQIQMQTSSVATEDKIASNQRQKARLTTSDFSQGNQQSVSQKAYLNVLRLFTMEQDEGDIGNFKTSILPFEEIFEEKFQPNQEAIDKFNKKNQEINGYFEENRREEIRLDYSKPEVAIDRAQKIHSQIKNFNVDLIKQFGTGPALSQHTDGTVVKTKSDIEIVTGEREQQARDSAEKEKQFEWLKFLSQPKHLYEEDPLKMKIEQIAELHHSTKVLKSDGAAQSFLIGRTPIRENNSSEHPAISEALREAFQEQSFGQSDEFLKEIFTDRLQVDSQFTTKGNFSLIQINDLAKEPAVKNERHQEYLKRLMPKWYKIANHALNMDPNDLGDIDFFRDLGPFQRLKPESGDFGKLKKKYFSELVDIISPEEIYLLSLSGLVPIEKLHVLEQMLPNQPPSDQYQGKPFDFSGLKQNSNTLPPTTKLTLADKFGDLTTGSDESADLNRQRRTRGLTLSGIEESMVESSILHSLSETELHTKLDLNDLNFLRQQLEQEEVDDETLEISEEDSERLPSLPVVNQFEQLRQVSTASDKRTNTDFMSTLTPPRSRNRTDNAIYNEHELMASQGQVLVESIVRLWGKVEQIQQEKVKLSKKYSRPETRRNVGANQPSYESKQRSLNKKLEKYLVRAIDIFDNIFEINERLSKEEKQPIQNLNTILLKAASIESENINDEIKAKFLYRVIREYRQIVEMNRQAKIREFREKQILQHMKKELPSLSPSLSVSPVRVDRVQSARKLSIKKQRIPTKSSASKKSVSPSPEKGENLVVSMSQGWGVSVPYRKTQHNNFSAKNPRKIQPAVPQIEKYESIMSQSQSVGQRRKVNHFRNKKDGPTFAQQIPSNSFTGDNQDQDESWFGEEAQDEAVWI